MQLLCGNSYWREERGIATTRRFRSALLGSLLFHCTLGGLATAVVLQKPMVQEPLMIDLTAASLPEAQPQAPKTATRNRSNSAAPARPALLSPPPQVATPAAKSPAVAPQPVAALSAKNDAVSQQAVSVGGQAATNSTAAGGTGSAQGNGQSGSGLVAAETKETLQKRYLREHFAYIRDLIGKELRYPRQAVRMGWHGRVTVSFLVLMDGSVTELRVSHSSGVPLLDRNALETVERAAPFPRPPVSARLVMPVDYVLE